MRIYTRTGDSGETGLVGGSRVPKDGARIEAVGAVDELNAHLGAARASLDDGELDALLARVQNELFDLGAELATPPSRPARGVRSQPPRVTAELVAALEADVDRLEADLQPLRQFILPGGTLGASALHVARAVCRRAERRVVTLARVEQTSTEAVRYLNRLSDLLFVMARTANARRGVSDVTWTAGSPAQGP